MGKQTINVGTTGNDGTGDDLRTAGNKINDNFTELYSDVRTLQVTTGATGTNLGVTFDSNQVIFEGTADSFETTLSVINPTKDNTINLPDSSGTLVLDTNIAAVVNSATLSIINNTVDSNYIAVRTGVAQDSGATLLIVQANSIDSTGARLLIDSAYVQARQLAGTDSALFTKLTAIAGHVVPSVDSTYDLGDSARKWKDLYLSGTTIHLGDTTIKNDGGSVKFGRPITANIKVVNSMDLQGNSFVDSNGMNMRSPKFNFGTIDGVQYIHFNQAAPQVRIGDSDTPAGYIQLGHNTSNSGSVGKGTVHYNSTDNQFNFKDSDGWFSLPRTAFDSADVISTVDSAYVRARVVEPDIRSYTVGTVPNNPKNGNLIFVSNGNSGAPCLAVFDSDAGFYKRIVLGTQIST
tara:strand:+ start:20863 stop:22080 length:1218 start_codon:yes stop_codon:yes gene_type:complete